MFEPPHAGFRMDPLASSTVELAASIDQKRESVKYLPVTVLNISFRLWLYPRLNKFIREKGEMPYRLTRRILY